MLDTASDATSAAQICDSDQELERPRLSMDPHKQYLLARVEQDEASTTDADPSQQGGEELEEGEILEVQSNFEEHAAAGPDEVYTSHLVADDGERLWERGFPQQVRMSPPSEETLRLFETKWGDMTFQECRRGVYLLYKKLETMDPTLHGKVERIDPIHGFEFECFWSRSGQNNKKNWQIVKPPDVPYPVGAQPPNSRDSKFNTVTVRAIHGYESASIYNVYVTLRDVPQPLCLPWARGEADAIVVDVRDVAPPIYNETCWPAPAAAAESDELFELPERVLNGPAERMAMPVALKMTLERAVAEAVEKGEDEEVTAIDAALVAVHKASEVMQQAMAADAQNASAAWNKKQPEAQPQAAAGSSGTSDLATELAAALTSSSAVAAAPVLAPAPAPASPRPVVLQRGSKRPLAAAEPPNAGGAESCCDLTWVMQKIHSDLCVGLAAETIANKTKSALLAFDPNCTEADIALAKHVAQRDVLLEAQEEYLAFLQSHENTGTPMRAMVDSIVDSLLTKKIEKILRGKSSAEMENVVLKKRLTSGAEAMQATMRRATDVEASMSQERVQYMAAFSGIADGEQGASIAAMGALEQRATDADRRAEESENALAELRSKFDQTMAELRGEVDLLKQSNEAAVAKGEVVAAAHKELKQKFDREKQEHAVACSRISSLEKDAEASSSRNDTLKRERDAFESEVRERDADLKRCRTDMYNITVWSTHCQGKTKAALVADAIKKEQEYTEKTKEHEETIKKAKGLIDLLKTAAEYGDTRDTAQLLEEKTAEIEAAKKKLDWCKKFVFISSHYRAQVSAGAKYWAEEYGRPCSKPDA